MDVGNLREDDSCNDHCKRSCCPKNFHSLHLVHRQILECGQIVSFTAICVCEFQMKIAFLKHFLLYYKILVYLGIKQLSLDTSNFEELCFTFVAGFAHFYVNGSFLLLFISMYLHHHAFYKMFKHVANKFKRSNHNRCGANTGRIQR